MGHLTFTQTPRAMH